MTRARKKMTERERFEGFARRDGYRTDRLCNGFYVTVLVNEYWKYWQAAKRDAKRRVKK